MAKQKRTTRRGNNEGSIYQRKDGRWVACITVGYDDNGKPVRKSIYGNTKQEVIVKLTTESENIVLTGCSSARNDSFIDIMTNWLINFKQVDISPRTYEAETRRAKNHIFPAFAQLRLGEVNTNSVQVLLNKMGLNGYAPATVRKVKFLLHQFFEYCVDCKMVASNPVDKCIVRTRKEHKEQTQEEYKAIPIEIREKFIEAISKDEFFKPLCLIQMFGGLRIGEALALKWKDINFDTHIINIDNAITEVPIMNREQQCVGKKTVISDTKTVASIREVPIPEILDEALKEWKQIRYIKQNLTGISFIGDEDIVFSNGDGELRTYSGTKTMFERLLKRNGLEKYGIHFHSLRHTYSSMLFESHENPKVIQMLLGHRDVTTTIKTYNSVDRSYFKQAVDKLNLKKTGG